MKQYEKIEGYNEMSTEEKLKALEALEVEESDNTKLKNALNKATSEAAEFKKQLREKQSEQERIEAERKEQEEAKDKELNELRREKNIMENKANFLRVGYPEELAQTSAIAIADNDSKTVFENLKTFVSERDRELKANALKNTPKPVGGTGETKAITKEEFAKMDYAAKNKLFEENPELYNSLKE